MFIVLNLLDLEFIEKEFSDKKMLNNTGVIIYGFGKFGKKALDYFLKYDIIDKNMRLNKSNDQNMKKNYPIIIIDKEYQDIKQNLNDYQKGKIEIINFKELKKNLDNILVKIQDKKIYFLQGNIELLTKILQKIIVPFWLIPTAPIHLMAEILKVSLKLRTLRKKQPTILVKKIKINANVNLNENLQNIEKNNEKKTEIKITCREIEGILPNIKNLNYHIAKEAIFFSYAPLGKECPDNCIGPPNFCPYFKLQKPLTITKIIEEIFINLKKKFRNKDFYYLFESKQITGGLGGILNNDLNDFLKLIKELKDNKNKQQEKKYFIATTCNCHGILNCF